MQETGDTGSMPGPERFPGVGNGNPLQYPCLENSIDKKSLAGYSPWGHKESDTIEHTHLHPFLIPFSLFPDFK